MRFIVRNARGRVVTGVGVALLAGTPAAAPAAPASAAGPVAADRVASSGGRWVTLVTGDRVLVGTRGRGMARDGIVKVVPGEGRTGMRFRRYIDRGDTYVVPMDALALIGRGLVDRRLFDVTGLIRAGHDDRARQDVPLIVTGTGKGVAAAKSGTSAAGAEVVRELPSVAGVAVSQRKAGAARFWDAMKGGSGQAARRGRSAGGLAPELTRIWLDGPVRAALDKSVAQIGAPAAWKAGHTGKGATVAVLDTGIDETHPDLTDAVAASKDFTGASTGVADGHGHGTHVASTITGSGAASDGEHAGVAPDAKLLVGKVLGDSGKGSDSQIIAGMEWATRQHASVVNISLGSTFPGDGTGVLDQAVDRLTADTGTLFVVAAGNDGPRAQSVAGPGTADAALTVGAVDDADGLASFSARGPRKDRPAIKPEITAPGVGIVAARAKGTAIGEPVNDRYTGLSGTSMAAPHVAGAAAILAAAHPDWKAGQLKAALTGSAKPGAGLSVYEQGAGRLDVARADAQRVRATPATVDGGIAQWPHADDKPVTVPITYRNDGSEPITLDLALDVRDQTGAAAADGMFTVSDRRITVPAGGEAKATVTIDTTGSGRDGLYGGTLTATGDGAVVRTPVGITKEVESHAVTFTTKNFDGAPTDLYGVWLVDEKNQNYSPYDPSGAVTVRLPNGTYYLSATVFSGEGEDYRQTAFVEPAFTVSGDTTIELDARDGKQIAATVDRPGLRSGGNSAIGYFRTFPEGASVAETYSMDSLDGFLVRPSRTKVPADQFTFAAKTQLAAPTPQGFTGPYLYHVQWTETGSIPNDPVRHIADKELAKVESEHAVTSGTAGLRDGMVSVPLPGRLTEYYTPDVSWVGSFREGDFSYQSGNSRTFQKGKTYRERWNSAVFGPADPSVEPIIRRGGDTLAVEIPLFSDQTANHVGVGATDEAGMTLYRDGRKIDETSDAFYHDFTLPADPASYRLDVAAARSVSNLSTRVNATYHFGSQHIPGKLTPLPILGIRLAPRLDLRNQAPSGTPFSFPVHITRQTGASTLKTLTVEASFDDGRTWQPVPLTGQGDHRTATLTHPKAKYVSLRAKATDTEGNGTEQTIIHAYALK
ncbi:S8 family serine peptidase [Spirillospora sp. NPDC048911]|uniref:S8 family serine peptidase n=1 Tax=Spirillospora sp. NPDC048911 TaxID=3364527 RepID=UPI00371E0F71